MSTISLLLKLAGKNNFELDSRIDAGYLFSQCWKYGWMIIRGRFFSIGKADISNNVLIGKHVRVKEKRKITIGNKCRLQDRVFIDALSVEGVMLGDYVLIGENCKLICTGSLSKIGKGIKIGNRTTFGADCFFGAAGGIHIGEDVIAGQNIRFHAENHNFEDTSLLIREQGVSHKGIRIGNNCWIGAGVVFLDGAELSDGCVVAANAVVSQKFPSNSVIGGVPAKIIKIRGKN